MATLRSRHLSGVPIGILTSLTILSAGPVMAVAAGAGQIQDPDDPGNQPPDVVVYSPAFVDVPADHVFAAEIRALVADGITRGCDVTATTFCPGDPVTRGQMAAFLVRALALDSGEGELPTFVDDDGSVYEEDIERLAAAGIARGCNPPENSRYCPDSPVTRGEMAAFLVRALAPAVPENPVEFSDDDGLVFESDIVRLAAAGITRGCNPPTNDRFCPMEAVERGEMAAFLTRALELEVPSEIPDGVRFSRKSLNDGHYGLQVSLCRDEELSVAVRSIGAGSASAVARWTPSVVEASVGAIAFEEGVWVLPAGLGCETLVLGWDPRANVVSAPLSRLEVTSSFGYRRHPILGSVRLHAGTDFAAATGTAVFAAAAGEVVVAGFNGGYGRSVDIKHPGGLLTRYGHLSSLSVAVGDGVEPGQVIGRSGCTGLCTGPHLHFETREWGSPVNPLSYLR